ncbi:hypothetical protein HNY73_018805 [Argiope bruennichi]|uniref:Uncharacterized protein n=1 Tax=Argiope bruennichi TaxID=94029 RepID=A0A8T0EEW5_ARGBR|nr:hypothetical protein HNY73_018805 [Argiope bruennichi]
MNQHSNTIVDDPLYSTINCSAHYEDPPRLLISLLSGLSTVSMVSECCSSVKKRRCHIPDSPTIMGL